ncbi:MAG: hypothetical protein Q9208_002435 [Pyrenodesmia sp. 3 TL-2023]
MNGQGVMGYKKPTTATLTRRSGKKQTFLRVEVTPMLSVDSKKYAPLAHGSQPDEPRRTRYKTHGGLEKANDARSSDGLVDSKRKAKELGSMDGHGKKSRYPKRVKT